MRAMLKLLVLGIAMAVLPGPARAADTHLTIMVFQGVQNLPLFEVDHVSGTGSLSF